MFCTNCGAQMMDNAAVCTQCGCRKGLGANYCPNCGRPKAPGVDICTNCGSAVGYVPTPSPTSMYTPPAGTAHKSKLAAGLLGIFLGSLGIHNFYLGYTTKAVVQLVVTLATLGIGGFVMGIWALVEAIMILTGKINVDGKGMPLGD